MSSPHISQPLDKGTILEPVTPSQRIELVDILRGFALTGVLLVNMMNYGGHLPRWTGSVDIGFHVGEYFFFEQRFWHLFSLLFGLGFAIQLLRADARQKSIVPVYLRRLLILLGFGALSFSLWDTDILTDYAILGVFLLLMRRWSPKHLLILALLIELAPVIQGLSQNYLQNYRMRDPQYAAEFQRTQKRDAEEARIRSREYRTVMAHGSFGEVVARNAGNYVRKLKHPNIRPASESWWGFFAMFLVGMYVGKRRILEDYSRHRRFVRAVGWIGMMVGVIGVSIFVWKQFLVERAPPPLAVRIAIETAIICGITGMTFFYAYLVSEWSLSKRLRPLQRGFAAVGRTALSNYLLQAMATNVLFMNWGLGYRQKLGPAKTMLLSVPIYVTLMLLSI